ncbi:hypothetical protein A2686_03010 [Candidatus Woesebacteria bacterium RIFCSPHIGHO2_01_FULL_38_10]|nr:MAG: hypothetical protein A2686_03010 [Candidatus Woesebacteria bacterium RIFCSPHIGHO2_01_FULL_38_10]
MKKIIFLSTTFFFFFLFFFEVLPILAQKNTLQEPEEISQEEATASSTILEKAKKVEPTSAPRADITRETEETVEPLTRLLNEQKLGAVLPYNLIKYAIRGAVASGVPPNTIVLLLLIPGVAALIAAARHLIGIRGFGIFLPAALSVSFVATGPIVGIIIFLLIVFVSTFFRMVLRRLSIIKLQYLPRMALMLHFVVLSILFLLFLAPYIKSPDISSVSIFPVLVLVLLSEDFSKVQLGKSVKVAMSLALETLILALTSFVLLATKSVQEFALLNPEVWILSIFVFDFLLGKYVGLRFMEIWRFRKLISG